jgi:hypothetical protein
LLAASYYKLGDDKWQSSIEKVLEREDYGLEHAKVNCKIAATLMNQGKFREALPYAEAGAGSGSSWGYRTYLECLTGLEQWDRAEQVARADSLRYRNNLWFAWCASTGHGDLDAAWQLEQQRLRQFDQLAQTNMEVEEMWYLIAKEDDQAALEHVTKIVDTAYRPWYNMMQVHLADAVDDAKLRDESLAKLAAWKPDNDDDWSVYSHMAPLLQQAIKEKKQLKLDDIRPIFEGRKDIDRWTLGALYSIGEFNRVHGEGDQRLDALKQLAGLESIDLWPRSLAWIQLRKEGIEPSQVEGRKFYMQYYGAEK